MSFCSISTCFQISDNKLDCSCQLKEFQQWLQNDSTLLNNQSRSSAKCETPRSKSNAALLDLPVLECSDGNENPYELPFLPFEDLSNQYNSINNQPDIDPNELSFTNWSFDESSRLLEIFWLPTINMSYYGCDQVQVQCVPSIHSDEEEKSNSKEVYSKPIECSNLSNHSLINVVR